MVQIDLLLHGIPATSNHGYLSLASSAMVDKRAVVDVGSLARRPLLETTLDEAGMVVEDVEDVLLTHLHYDHCDNVDLFPEATVHVYEEEYRRVAEGDLDWATPRNATAVLDDLDLELFDVGDVVAGLEVVATPGHIEHHVGFLAEDNGVTYGLTGDAMKNVREVATMDPMVLYDEAVAVETMQWVCDRVDFVVPGHDTPFHISEDGQPIPAVDVDFDVNLAASADVAAVNRVELSRSNARPLPENVTDLTVRQ